MVQNILKNFKFKKREQKIQGFDIDLQPEHLTRIDRLVDRYETEILHQLDDTYTKKTHWADKLADRFAQFGGSWRFIIYFGMCLALWIIWNTNSFIKHQHLVFDEAPFILLNLCLSFIAAFQAPIIMMSQNRQAVRDKHEAIIDFAINYKAEQEIDDMQTRLCRMEEDLHVIRNLLQQLQKNNT